MERTTVPVVHVAKTDAERRVLAHVRGWCHDSSDCLICRAELRAHVAETAFNSIVSG